MTLVTHEFIRRFLIHVLPAGFHRIRYYGLLTSGKRAENIARACELLMPPIIPVGSAKTRRQRLFAFELHCPTIQEWLLLSHIP